MGPYSEMACELQSNLRMGIGFSLGRLLLKSLYRIHALLANQ